MSGIYKGQDYGQGHWECLPYNQSSLRTVYHVRSLEVFRLNQLKEKVNVMLSHDWPRGITDYGNTEKLLHFKTFLRYGIFFLIFIFYFSKLLSFLILNNSLFILH